MYFKLLNKKSKDLDAKFLNNIVMEIEDKVLINYLLDLY